MGALYFFQIRTVGFSASGFFYTFKVKKSSSLQRKLDKKLVLM